MGDARPPFLLRPHYIPKPWGGRQLADVLGRTDLPDGPVGESWEVADTDTVQSVVEGGPLAGKRLRDVWGGPFPLLLKVLDAREPLSVQLHPDGADGGPAKEEAWVALADGGRVALGAFAGRELPEDRWLDGMETVPLSGPNESPPSLVHVPPGTVHAILGGSLLFEVQNPVDVTWRLDDHGRVGLDGRPRALHLDQARALLSRPLSPCRSERSSALELRGQRFAVRLHPPGAIACDASPNARAAFFLEGGTVRGAGGALDVPRARTAVLPASACTLQSGGWAIQAEALSDAGGTAPATR